MAPRSLIYLYSLLSFIPPNWLLWMFSLAVQYGSEYTNQANSK